MTAPELTWRHADGLDWVARGGVSGDHVAYDDHEPGLAGVLAAEWDRARRDGKCFLDVGAHVGRYALRAAYMGVRVLAVEPNPATLRGLALNARRNRVRGLTVLPVAAWSTIETVELRRGARHGDEGSRTVQTLTDTVATCPVSACPLDLLVHEPVGVVKIDVEGAEAVVLRGLTETVAVYRPVFVIELHDRYYGDDIRAAVLAQLAAWGYVATRLEAVERATPGQSGYILARSA